ncbi:serine kinase [Trinickia terrae]|uniref:Serine kinase n=1 Tax=Trinickia terrae TaxID=2571161 RepID=A0A4U1I1A7_9BURK|nr:serine kinase [Trinickia terrae]TKC86939.1 serine kinase [Trinickia terrae]
MSLTAASQFHYEIARATETAAQEASPAPQALADKFQAMMAQATPAVPAAHPGEHANIVTKAVEEQADYYRQVPNDVMYMTQHMSALSMERLAAADMTIQLEIASLNADLQVKMATVQSSKDAVQTLMKNQ